MSDKNLPLSQAIRNGAKLKPEQAFKRFFDGNGSCALGAAADATGYGSAPAGQIIGVALHLQRRFPVLTENDHALFLEIRDRNDRFKETREQIADSLEARGL